MLIDIYVISLISGFILLVAKKIGLIEHLQINTKSDLFYKLLTCNFCLSWWTCLIVSVFYHFFNLDTNLLLLAVCATPITRLYIDE